MKLVSKWKKLFYDLPIMGKLLALMIVSSLCPILLITAYSYTSAKRQLLQQAYEDMNQMNRQINNAISNQLSNFRQISEMLYSNATLKAYLARNYHRDIDFVEAYGYINDLFWSLMAANEAVAEITIYVQNPTIPSDGAFVKHLFNEKDTPDWVRSLDQSYENPLYTGTYENAYGERIISLGKVMDFTSISYPYGVLSLSMREEDLYSLIRQESEKKQIYIIDKEGRILSTKDKSLLSQRLADIMGRELPQEEEGYVIMDVGDSQSLVVYNHMNQGWKTVTLIPLENILNETRKGVRNILGIAAISLTLSLGMIVLISSYFNGRIRDLTKQTERIQAGDFKSRIEVRGNDEIGQLSTDMNNMTKRLDGLIKDLYREEISRRDAELYALQSQINPHFLYNTLSTISSLAIRRGDDEISSLINHLSSFYRISLNKGMRYITVENELAITRHYIAVQHMRFGNHFQEIYETDEKLYPYKTLKLVLQPFVENAINHAMGIGTKPPLHIYIRLYREQDVICFEIEDDGQGLSEEKLKQLEAKQPEVGFGIRNVDERIRLAYGKDYGVSIRHGSKRGTKVKVTIPI